MGQWQKTTKAPNPDGPTGTMIWLALTPSTSSPWNPPGHIRQLRTRSQLREAESQILPRTSTQSHTSLPMESEQCGHPPPPTHTHLLRTRHWKTWASGSRTSLMLEVGGISGPSSHLAIRNPTISQSSVTPRRPSVDK